MQMCHHLPTATSIWDQRFKNKWKTLTHIHMVWFMQSQIHWSASTTNIKQRSGNYCYCWKWHHR